MLRPLPLDSSTAAWLLDLCGQLQVALWQQYGDKIEAHWAAREPGQPIYDLLQGPRRKS